MCVSFYSFRGAALGGIWLLLVVGVSAAPATDLGARPIVPAVLLLPPREHTALDEKIIVSQRRLRDAAQPAAELERLGWLYVAKARATSDPGFFSLASLVADALEEKFESPREAWLLRGQVLQTRHQFAAAEALGRKLVDARGEAADYALLGDSLYDQGRIGEAASAYQQMVDLKPGLDSYTRAATIRWIKGDVRGAAELQALAVRAGGPGDPGALAWSLCRLAQLLRLQGDVTTATACVDRALVLVPEFQPALLLRGRMRLAAGSAQAALEPLARAASILPLPEPRWVYAEALREVARTAEAEEIEQRLVREGMAEDPRTVAQFLASRGQQPDLAVRLAQAELSTRSDIMTHATTALALAAAGRPEAAMADARAALAEGTQDPQLSLYAGRVALLAHQPEAKIWLQQAEGRSALLLPSEQALLRKTLSLLPADFGLRGGINQPTQE